MRRFEVNADDWQKIEGEFVAVSRRLLVSCAGKATLSCLQGCEKIYLATISEEQAEITCTPGQVLLFDGDHVFVHVPVRDQTNFRQIFDCFTSLDRPAALSQEQLAIERLVRRNSIERERERGQMERRIRSLESRLTAGAADVETETDLSSQKAGKVRRKSKPSGSDTGSTSDGSSELSELDVSAGSRETERQDREARDDDSGHSENTPGRRSKSDQGT